jgi:transposase
MPYKRITVMDMYELLRRRHDGQTISEISRALNRDRKTIRAYLAQVQEAGVNVCRPLPPKGKVMACLADSISLQQRPKPQWDRFTPHLQEIETLIHDPVEPLRPKIAWEVICQKYELTISYSTFRRFIQAHRVEIFPKSITCRIEVSPGEEVQIDYGYMGLLWDPVSQRNRKVYAFIATLGHSRHKYVEFTYTQNQQSFVASHVKLFEYLGGVPRRVLIDNLKSGVIKPDLYDPVLNRSYQEMAEHYGCFIDPCRVGHAKDKAKVERSVPVARQLFRKLKKLRTDLDVVRANDLALHWAQNEYGQRQHGTTGENPYPVFLETERPALRPLPSEPFEIAVWKQARVHPDHYVQFERKAYSVPSVYVGQTVWVRGTHNLIQIFLDHQLIKQHLKAKGYRQTDLQDFPENIRIMLDQRYPTHLQKQAGQIGPHFQAFIRRVLAPHAYINLRKAQGILQMRRTYPAELLEGAAQFALANNLIDYRAFKGLVEKMKAASTEQNPLPIPQQTDIFVREASYFIKP